MANQTSCILYYYERDNQYLARLLSVDKELSDVINTIEEAQEKVDILEKAGILQPGEIVVNVNTYNSWYLKFRNAISEYNKKCLSSKIVWYIFDESSNDFIKATSDHKKIESKFQNNLLIKLSDLGTSLDKEAAINQINKKKNEVKYAIFYCDTCKDCVVTEYRDGVAIKCPRCGSILNFDSRTKSFSSKQEAYNKYFKEIKAQSSQASVKKASFYCYKGRNYRFNNNDLISLLKNIVSNIDYNNILTVSESGVVSFKEAFKDYLIQCNPEFENILTNDEFEMSSFDIVKSFYYFVTNDNLKNLKLYSSPFILFSMNGRDILLNNIDEIVDLFLKENDDNRKELIKVFLDPLYNERFFKKVSKINGAKPIDLSYLLYERTRSYWYVSYDFTSGYKVRDFGQNFLQELSKYEDESDVICCFDFLNNLKGYPLFNVNFTELAMGSYSSLCVIEQQINKSNTFNFKGITFSTDIEEAAKNIGETIRFLYLEGKSGTKEYFAIKELLCNDSNMFKFFNFTSSEIMNKLKTEFSKEDVTLLDLYLCSSQRISFKDSKFLINGVKGTIVEIARTAIQDNWINKLLVDQDYLQIRDTLIDAKDISELHSKSESSFAELSEKTK